MLRDGPGAAAPCAVRSHRSTSPAASAPTARDPASDPQRPGPPCRCAGAASSTDRPAAPPATKGPARSTGPRSSRGRGSSPSRRGARREDEVEVRAPSAEDTRSTARPRPAAAACRLDGAVTRAGRAPRRARPSGSARGHRDARPSESFGRGRAAPVHFRRGVPGAGEHAMTVAIEQTDDRPCGHDPGRSAPGHQSGHGSYEPVAATTLGARISYAASLSIAATIPSYQPTAKTPVSTWTPAGSATGPLRPLDHGVTVEPAAPRARACGREAAGPPPPTTSTSASSPPYGRSRARSRRPAPSRSRPRPPNQRSTSRYALPQPPRPEEPMVVERRRDPASDQAHPRQQVALDRWPGVLAARDESRRARVRGTTERSAGHRPRTRTSRTGRSSTSTRAAGGTGSSATGRLGPRRAARRPAARLRRPRTSGRRS